MPRIGFIVEQVLGHITHGQNLQRVVAEDREVQALWGLPTWDSTGIESRLPGIRSNWTLRAGLQVRRFLRAANHQARLEALFIHTQVPAVLAQDWMGRIPTIVSLDATPQRTVTVHERTAEQAVDREGNVGVFVANPAGGTIGWSYGILSARGCHLIVPVGLEKLVPSVRQASRSCGQETFYYNQGIKIGMIPIMNGEVITEIQAFQVLFDLKAVHIGGGGVNGSEGSVVIVAEGEKNKLDRAIQLIEKIKGEPPLRPKKSLCINCFPTIPSIKDASVKLDREHCMYQGRREEDLPLFLRRHSS